MEEERERTKAAQDEQDVEAHRTKAAMDESETDRSEPQGRRRRVGRRGSPLQGLGAGSRAARPPGSRPPAACRAPRAARGRRSPLVLEAVDGRASLATVSSSLSGALRRCARAAGGLQQVERDRRLAGEEPEQLDLLERRARPRGPVEHLQDAERPLLVEERDSHQPLRHVSRRLGRVLREARILADVLEHERLARHEHPARDARAGWKAGSDEAVRAPPRRSPRRRARPSPRRGGRWRPPARGRSPWRPRRSSAGAPDGPPRIRGRRRRPRLAGHLSLIAIRSRSWP